LSEKEYEKEDKSKDYAVKIVEDIPLADTATSSISTISGLVKQSFDALRGTFDTNQKFIADSTHLERNLEYLQKIAESTEKAARVAEEQRNEAVIEAKKNRNRSYAGIVIAVVGIVVTAIIGIIM
jgi:C4-type Zn-finger protein